MDTRAFRRQLAVDGQTVNYFDVNILEQEGIASLDRLPFAIKILLENLLRKLDGSIVTETDLTEVARWRPRYDTPVEIPFHPARVLMQDFTGVPAVVDLAAMREAVAAQGADPSSVNPLVPVELIADHSVQVDAFGTCAAATHNVAREYERNRERYALLKWAQQSFANVKVVPPNSGICHQVNLEYLSRVVATQSAGGRLQALPDTLVGTDSHTPMVNGIGVMGWGVGGIEAEAVMLGQPYYMAIPEVIGVRLEGELPAGATATDLVLTITQRLRALGVVEKFVEYFGPGLDALSVADRATIANMTPEYGATLGFFPVDRKTLEYLRTTGRAARTELIERYCKAQGMFYTPGAAPEYTQVVDLDLGRVEPCVAGPARPQDRIALTDLKAAFSEVLGCAYDRDADLATMSTFIDESGCQTRRRTHCRPVSPRVYPVEVHGRSASLGDGSIVIAAITSCTNTSNPAVMLGAGLLARNAVQRGLRVPPHVKTSLAPGSRVVTRYLASAGLMPYLEALGFHVAGYGCTTCIGNSGPLHPDIERTVRTHDLNVAAVLSGNRNFEARIHQRVKSNFLASPPLVVAFALAGRIDVDLTREPVGLDANGDPVYLSDLWPGDEEIAAMAGLHVQPEFYREEYGRIFDGDRFWTDLPVAGGTTYPWDPESTYIRLPPFFDGFQPIPAPPDDIRDARVLMLLGDTVTTDHISPAGAIPADYPAGAYLQSRDVPPEQFNSYGSRRGNHEVMMRGTFGNIRIKNQLVAPQEGSRTRVFPDGTEASVYDAARHYAERGVPLLVLAGVEYGTGSSRDWAAKGTALLGVRAVIAASYERIHRNNLVGMGVLPLTFQDGEGWRSLGLDGSETYRIQDLADLRPRQKLAVRATRGDGSRVDFTVTARLDTEVDVAYFAHGGILPYVLRHLLADGRPADTAGRPAEA